MKLCSASSFSFMSVGTRNWARLVAKGQKVRNEDLNAVSNILHCLFIFPLVQQSEWVGGT